jgi:hypothetical protein
LSAKKVKINASIQNAHKIDDDVLSECGYIKEFIENIVLIDIIPDIVLQHENDDQMDDNENVDHEWKTMIILP